MSDDYDLFIDSDIVKQTELFLEPKWSIKEMVDRIYVIKSDGKEIEWFVKTYAKKKYAKHESKNLHKLKDLDGVPKLLLAFFSENTNFIILSRAPGMDLFDYIEQHGVFSEKEAKNIMRQLFDILKYIHRKNIIHGDIKPENIIYNGETKRITLIDFENDKYTQDYRSPESIKKKKTTSKIDVWSAGITLYYLLKGKVPFNTKEEILNKPFRHSKKWSENLCSFFDCTLERDPELRFDSGDISTHDWFD